MNERKPAEKLVIQKKIDPKGKSVNKSVDEWSVNDLEWNVNFAFISKYGLIHSYFDEAAKIDPWEKKVNKNMSVSNDGG